MDMKQIVAERIACAAEACFENCGLCCGDVVAMLELPPDSAESGLHRICRHLDIIRNGSALKKELRANVVERYSHKRRLPSHMEELKALCAEHAF